MAEPEHRERSRSPAPTGRAFWQAQLEAIYTRRNPAKLSTVPELLQKYNGREAVLYASVCRKYDLNPTKFHTEQDAWLEYDLTENHGPHLDANAAPVSAAPFNITVTTLAGATASITVSATDSVKLLLKKAATELGFPPWSSKLCKLDQTLRIDKKLHAEGVGTGDCLTLVQEPEPELDQALEKFRSGPPGDATSVFVAQCVQAQRVLPQPMSTLVGVFKKKADAVEAIVDKVKEAWDRVMLNAFELEDNSEYSTRISGAADRIELDVPFEDSFQWTLEETILR